MRKSNTFSLKRFDGDMATIGDGTTIATGVGTTAAIGAGITDTGVGATGIGDGVTITGTTGTGIIVIGGEGPGGPPVFAA